MPISILLAYHSCSEKEAFRIGDFFKTRLYNVYYINETLPEKLSTRSLFVKNCCAFIAIASFKFQKSVECMELLHYSKDIRKDIYGINFNQVFRPFGAFAAILCGTELGILNIKELNQVDFYLDPILVSLENLKSKLDLSKIDPLIDTSRIASAFVKLNFTNKQFDIILSHHSDSVDIANLIEEAFKKNNLNYSSEDSSTGTSSVNNCKTIVVILSQGYEESFNCKEVIETARSMKKKIIPVSKTRNWKPQSWLGLVTAGKLFYRIMDASQAYSKKFENDYSPMNELIGSIYVSILSKIDEDETEKDLIESLKKEIEECKAKLPEWPPKLKEIKSRETPRPVKVELKEIKLNGIYTRVSYNIIKIFTPENELTSRSGVISRRKYDCMISYQWDHQAFVRDLYMNLKIQNIGIWFDIWGGMDGNANHSMATAIENSKVVLVFLSNKYLGSQNCVLEIKYAIFCGKPFIFILTEPLNGKIENWLKEQLDQSPKFELANLKDAMDSAPDQIPKIELISQAIRDIGFAQPDYDVTDFVEEIYQLKHLLNSALDEIALRSGENRFKTCTRCNKQYEERNNKKGDCKSHLSFYVGGSLIQSIWTCCKQFDKNAQGCVPDVHINIARVWNQKNNHWEPK